MKKRKEGFTLIELIAVLVILAIIALIATPLVMNIVKKAKDSANKRSVDAYGKAVELAIATHLLDTGDYPTSLDNLTVEYSGNEVVCNIKTLNEDGSVYLSECSVKGTDVKDNNAEDGWYHYGKNSSIAYQSYNIGDVVTYNGMDFYVIEASDETSDRVTMLKAEPLTYEEIQNYSAGTGASTYDNNGYGGMQYGATSEYETSYVKVAVEAWTVVKLKSSDLTADSLGYKTRLITYNELITNLGYDPNDIEPTSGRTRVNDNVPKWAYHNDYAYWTMSSRNDSNTYVNGVNYDGIYGHYVIIDLSYPNYRGAVRPVVTLKKSAI